jgi:hypothetical protein
LSSADLPTLAGDKVQMFGNDSNRSRLHSWRNLEQIKFEECLIPFSSESFVPFFLLLINVKSKMYKIIILPVVLYSCGAVFAPHT